MAADETDGFETDYEFEKLKAELLQEKQMK